MEQIHIILDNDEAYDGCVRGPNVLPSTDDPLTFITKRNGTQGGRGIVLFTFLVVLPDGSCKRAQYTTTIRQLLFAGKAIGAHYDAEGFPIDHTRRG